MSQTIDIRMVQSDEDIQHVRQLLAEYAEHLRCTGVENVCFAKHREELAGLPGAYSILLLAIVKTQEIEEGPAGCVLLQPLSAPTDALTDTGNENACEMKRMWVRPSCRGLGVGRLLAEKLIEQARLRGYTAMYLDTVPHKMREAATLYRNLGFEPVERYNESSIKDIAFYRRAL